MADFLGLEAVTKRYGKAAALDAVTIGVGKGDFLTLVGPSGSGKSTALMAIAGFVRPDSGQILFEGRDITQVAPEKRGFGVVFQGYALFPHMSVARNVAYPLEVRGEGRAAIEARVRRVLDLVQLQGLEERRPAMLSGGQQQRVAIARALVYEPPLLLLDEPLSALDRKLRGELQAGLKALHARLGTTFVNVTHDQDEALGLSTSVVVLSNGRVMQQGSPGEIYDCPATAFVADFIGNANLIPVERATRNGDMWTGLAGDHPIRFRRLHPLEDGNRAMVAVRQEAIGLGETSDDECNVLPAVILDVERIGPVTRILVEASGVGPLRLTSRGTVADAAPIGSTATVWWRLADTIHVGEP